MSQAVALTLSSEIGYRPRMTDESPSRPRMRTDPTDRPNRVSLLRSRRGWTQGRLAEEVGVARTYITRLEKGEFEMSADMVDKLASALDCEKWELFKGAPDLTKEHRDLIAGFDKRSPEKKEAVRTMTALLRETDPD